MTDSELMQLSEQIGQALKARGATRNQLLSLVPAVG